MNEQQITKKIKIIEQSIQNTKASLKTWVNQIGKYYTQLKDFTNQLATLKKQIETNMIENNENNKPDNQGGTK